MTTAIELQQHDAQRGLMPRVTVDQMNAQRQAIVDCMARAMRKDFDYGKIPGAGDKNTLFKPGAEKLLSLFHLAARPVVEDLSTPDTIRYRVTVELTSMGSGTFVGSGIGEASSAESKYQWRAAVCDEEFMAAAEDRRRYKWKKGQGGKPYTALQVRADMEDVANTILKMAKKRALADAVLTVTAASDIFTQDVEDLADAGFDPEGFVEGAEGPEPPPTPRSQEFTRATPAQQQQGRPAAAAGSAKKISEAQAKLFFARAMNSGKSKDDVNSYLKSRGCDRTDDIPAADFNQALEWANAK